MNNIDVSKWKEFKISDIFPYKKVKKYSKEPEDKGEIAYVTSLGVNNGVVSYSDANAIGSNVITVSTNGDCFDCFYHDESIAVSSDVEVLFNEHLNRYNALFICTVLELEKKKYSYGRKPKSGKVYNTTIKLPADENGNPDWIYMEQYSKDNWCTLKDTSIIESNVDFNVKAWKEYPLNKLFSSIKKAKAYVKSNIIVANVKDADRTPFVSRTDVNNGVDCYVVDMKTNFKYETGNAMIIGDTTSTCYYQESDFITGDHIVVLRADWLNKYRALFIKTILEKDRYKYNYGRSFKLDTIKKTIIKIPVDSEGNPDWVYMENYIKSLPYSDRI